MLSIIKKQHLQNGDKGELYVNEALVCLRKPNVNTAKFTSGIKVVQWLSYICAMKILMVCLGNICRSPLAEGILQKKIEEAGLQWYIDSAGTNGLHIGEKPHPLSQKVALLHNIDISKQRSRKFVQQDFDKFDKIYAMATDVVEEMEWIARDKFNIKKVDLLLNELYPGQNRDVPDPWYGTEAGYHRVFDMIDKACDALIENQLKQLQPSETPISTNKKYLP